MTWTCYARPAGKGGRTCFHKNKKGLRARDNLLCCEDCGATKLAGDDRKRRGDVDKEKK